MRRHGSVPTAAGLGLQGHACWIYSHEEEFRAGAIDFLEDGIELGQRLVFVGAGSIQRLRSELAGLSGLDELLGEGRLRIMPLENVYDIGVPVDPVGQLTMYAAMTASALRDGLTGLRVVAEVTPLVLDPALWASHTHWESAADRYIAKNPLAGLCCYDRRALPDEVLADLACVHRTSHGSPSPAPFHVFAGREGVALAGEVDSFSAGDLRRLLALATPPTGDLVLELDELEFIDHHGVLAVADRARALAREGRSVQLRGAPRAFDRLSELLEVEL